jgi:uncharacterized protein
MMLDKKQMLAAVKAQFKLDWDGDHGVRHWGRVFGRGVLLCRDEPDPDLEVVKAFALLHDACRIDDMEDPDHGSRAEFFARSAVLHGQLMKSHLLMKKRLNCAMLINLKKFI